MALNRKRALSIVIAAAGLGLVVVGVALIYLPAGLVVAGGAVAASSVLIDYPTPARRSDR